MIVFDDMISHVMSNKKSQQVLKELFIRCRKLNISLCFLTQSYFSVSETKENCKMLLLITVQILIIKTLLKIYRNCTKEPYSFLTIDTTQSVDKRF